MSTLLFIKDWIFPVVYGLFVPFIAVWVGKVVTKKHAEKEARREEQIQKYKILNLLKHEAELFIKYRIEKGTYRSRKFITAQLVLDSPAFNVHEHSKLIELVLEVQRLHDNIDIAVQASTSLVTSTASNYAQPSFWIVLAHGFEKLRGKESPVEKVLKSMNDLIIEILEESTKEAEPVIQELLSEINNMLGIVPNIRLNSAYDEVAAAKK